MTVDPNSMIIMGGTDDYPNVVRLNIPTNHRDEGAAWIYVPAKDTIYIGPPGSSNTTLDLLEAVERLTDAKAKDKLVSGILYDDGYSDIVTHDVNSQTEGKLLHALQNYHSQYYDGDENFLGENGYMNYPMEDDTSFDPEDDHGDVAYKDAYDADEIYDPDTKTWFTPKTHTPTVGPSQSQPDWFTKRDYSGQGDYSKLKPTPGVEKPIHDWDPQDYLNWREQGRKKNRGSGLGYSSWGSTREDYNHWRWSYGDSNLVSGPPHEGLWLWPTENGYPDHFSQTGSKGLGNCAQGRVYPHVDNRWEILTWPDRPRNVKDLSLKKAIQHESQQAVKRYLMEKIGVPEDKIFFTEGGYVDMVTWHDSPSYPDRSKSKSPYKSYPSDATDDYEDIDEWLKGRGKSVEPHYDDKDGSSYYLTYDPKTQTTQGTGTPNKLMQKVIDHLKNKPQQGLGDAAQQATDASKSLFQTLTPEERWEETVRDFERNQQSPEIPEGTTHDPLSKYVIHKRDNRTTVVSEQDYERAVEEYGDEHWWLAFVSPKEVNDVESITKEGSADNPTLIQAVVDAIESSVATFGDDPVLKNWVQNNDGSMEYRGSTELATIDQPLVPVISKQQIQYGELRNGIKTEAFVWLGFGYGPDKDDTDASRKPIVETGTTHWTIMNRIKGSSDTLTEFMKKLENGSIDVPMVWGWVERSPNVEGLIVTFLTHMASMKQDLEYIPQALAAVSNHYSLPIKDYDIEETETPVLESYTPHSVETTGPPTKAPPLASPDPTSDVFGIGAGGREIVADDTIGYVRVTTEKKKEGEWNTFVQGGELDGCEFPSFSEAEALESHNWIVKDEHRIQQTEKRMTTGAAAEFKAIEVDPGPNATHSDKERPFIYYPDTHTLYYTTTYCHHAHIVPKIVQMRQAEGTDPYYLATISGDITEKSHNGRHWIKFINGDSFPSDLIRFLVDKFGQRDIMYSGEYGYTPAEPSQFYVKHSFETVKNTPREDRVAEWRWSYDPDVDDIKVWEVNDGYPSHTDMTGQLGPYKCAQGRIYLLKDNEVEIFFWKNRPMSMSSGEEKEALQQKGWDAAWQWVQDNGIGGKNKVAKVATTPIAPGSQQDTNDVLSLIKWGWYCAYSPMIHAAGHILVTYTMNAMNAKLDELELGDEATPFAVGVLNGNIIVRTANDVSDQDLTMILNGVQVRWGMKAYTYQGLIEAHEKGELHQMFLPSSGCFGFLAGYLILGRRHHQEIMYRLLQHGWSWEDLLNAPQAWGWFHYYPDSGSITMWFSSDAGLMTSKQTQTAAKAAFASMFNAEINETNGYGGKDSENFGGNFGDKYGDPKEQDPDDMEGYKAKLENTIISPLPPPPAKSEEEPKEAATEKKLPIVPGGGIQPPKKKTLGLSDFIATNVSGSMSKRATYHALDDPIVAGHVWKYLGYFEKLPVR